MPVGREWDVAQFTDAQTEYMVLPFSPTEGTLDSNGASDCDRPYLLAGWRARSTAPYPFSTRQFARLLIVRSLVTAGLYATDDLAAAD
jgi:hypothetical protein